MQQEVRKETNGLLMIGDFGNPQHETVMFFHRTFADYLREHGEDWFPDRDQMMFDACLAYLRLDVFKRPFQRLEDLDQALQEYPFASYAAQFWGEHLRKVMQGKQERKNENTIKLLELLNDQHRKTAIVQIALHVMTNSDLAWDVQADVSPLHICAFNGLTEICEILIAYGEDVDCLEDTYGQTALHYACRRGHIDVVRVLLDENANVNLVSDKQRTPLTEAIEHTHMNVVDILLRHRSIDVNAAAGGNRKLTALTFAAERGQVDMVKRLLEHPEIQINHVDGFGCTALTWAVRCPSIECVDVLLQRSDIDLTIKDHRIGSPLEYIANKQPQPSDEAIFNLFLQNKGAPVLGGEAIQHLIEDSRIELVKIFLQHHFYADWKDAHGRSLLHIAAFCSRRVQTVELVYDHLSKAVGFDVDTLDNYDCTALHAACARFDTKDDGSITERLLKYGANATVKNARDQMPIDVAYQSVSDTSRDAVSKVFLPYFPQGLGGVNKTPLVSIERVVDNANLERLKTALQLEPTPLRSTPNPYTGWTVLHLSMNSSCGIARPDMLEVLLPKAMPYLNTVNDAGRTCLHQAAFKGSEAAINLLIQAGADMDIEDKWGDTAFEIAQQGRHESCAVILMEAGARISRETVKKDLIHHAIRTADVTAVKKLVDIGVDIYHQQNGTGLTALGHAKDLYQIVTENAERDLALSTQWLNQQKFPDITSFHQAARDTPLVKALAETVDCLQKARRPESRGRFMHRDFSALIESLRSMNGTTQPESRPNMPNQRTPSERSPPPPYSPPPSRVNSNPWLTKRQSGVVTPPRDQKQATVINLMGIQVVGEKTDRLIMTVVVVLGVVAIASLWLVLHYAVQLTGNARGKSEI